MKFKPIVNLKESESSVVNIETKKDFYTLMKIYELGGWKWGGKDLPTSEFYWAQHEEKTIVNIRKSLGYGTIDFFKSYKVLSLEDFYKFQNITTEKIRRIENYFSPKKFKNSFSLRNLCLISKN